MRKLYILGLIALSAIFFNVASAEEITLTTYYPAPYGVYNQMNTRTLGIGDNDGDGQITSNDAPDATDLNKDGEVWIAGKVGIGTMDPQEKMDFVDGDLMIQMGKGLFPNDWGDGIVVSSTAGGNQSAGFAAVGDTEAVGFAAMDATGEMRLKMFYWRPGPDNHIRSVDYPLHILVEGGNADMSLQADGGNVGIGTTTPQATLDIEGNVNFNGQKFCYCIYNYLPIAPPDGQWVSVGIIVPGTWTAVDCDRLCSFASDYPGNSNNMYSQVYCAWDRAVAGGNKFSGAVYQHRWRNHPVYGTGQETWPSGRPSPNCGW